MNYKVMYSKYIMILYFFSQYIIADWMLKFISNEILKTSNIFVVVHREENTNDDLSLQSLLQDDEFQGSESGCDTDSDLDSS